MGDAGFTLIHAINDTTDVFRWVLFTFAAMFCILLTLNSIRLNSLTFCMTSITYLCNSICFCWISLSHFLMTGFKVLSRPSFIEAHTSQVVNRFSYAFYIVKKILLVFSEKITLGMTTSVKCVCHNL